MSGNQPPWGSPPGGAPGAPNPWGTPSQGGVPSQSGAPSPYSGQGPGAPAPGMPSLSSPNPPPSPYAGQGPGGAPSPYAGQAPGGSPSPYAGQAPGGSPSPYAGQPAAPYAGQAPAPSPYGGPPASGGADPYAAFASAPGASPYGAGGAPPANPYANPYAAANPYASYAAPATGATRSEIGGWLLFLCIALTILVPLGTLSTVGNMMRFFGGFAGPMAMSMMIELGIAAYSVYTGIGLWTKREKAVRHAKIFFGVRAGIAVVRTFMFPGGIMMAMSMGGPAYNPMVTVIFTLLGCGIWFAYLNQSVRVRETYGSNN